MRPIIILGFGRSGTTWVADIISRLLGDLILFEPLHPSVTEFSEEWSYRRVCQPATAKHFENVLEKVCRTPWLLRNHVPTRLEDTSPKLLEYIWRECGVAGFKEIRLNFAIPWIVRHDVGRILFVMRDPREVITSLLNRPNFWEFSGLEGTYAMIARNLGLTQPRNSEVEKLATLWAVTHKIALADCAEHGIPVLWYDDLRGDPFAGARHIMHMVGIPERPIHPSHLFQPSLTTRRTFDSLYSNTAVVQRSLSEADLATIEAILDEIGVPDRV